MTEEVKEPKKVKEPAKKSKKSLIIMVVSIVVVAIAAVVAWGFYSGYQVRSFALDSESKVAETAKWEEQLDELDLDYENMDFTEYKATFQEVANEAKGNVTTIESERVPAKAEELKDNMVTYYTQISELATDLAAMMDDIDKEMSKFKAIEDKYTNTLDNLDSMTLSELEDVLDDATLDLENIDDMEVGTLANLEKQYKEIEEKAEAIGELEEVILAQIGELKNVKFYLF